VDRIVGFSAKNKNKKDRSSSLNFEIFCIPVSERGKITEEDREGYVKKITSLSCFWPSDTFETPSKPFYLLFLPNFVFVDLPRASAASRRVAQLAK